MDPTVAVNERVEVIVAFRRQGTTQGALCIPHKMRWKDREITFQELSLRHPTVQGKRMIHVFHVSDGGNGYRLEFDAEALTWTLVSMIEAPA